MFKNENGQLNFIDLFAGAGGLSEGFFQAGFNPIAHVEMNKSASKTLETRSAYYYLKKNNELDLYYQYERGQITRDELFSHIPDDVIKTVINAEMSPDTLPGIFEQIDTILKEDKVSDVDVIIGGPPCQAYSLVGRAQSSHMLTPMEEDPRNELYKMYTRFLTKYQPRMFVFENVAGLLTARGGDAFKNLTAHLKRVGYEIDFKEQNAADFRVLQKRKRIIIIGWRKGTDYFYPEFEKIKSNAIVYDLLDDLAPVERGQENDAYRLTYDQCSAYLKENNIRTEEDVVTHHIARPNNDSLFDLYGLIQFIDKRIFYSKAVFSDRYIKNEQYEDLRHQVSTVLQRTLRKEVSDYIQFPERKEMTVDFELSLPEVELYMKINNYLKKEILFALPNSHRALITSVIRKLLASSSMAVTETFRTLKNRLVILKETTREESVEESLDFFFSFFDDDEVEDEQENDNVDQLYTREKVNEFIQHEIDEIGDIINTAEKIKKNAKMTALKTAVRKAFDFQRDAGIKEKVVIFTESVRTQQYIFEELSDEGYQGQILKFNGSSGDDTTKELFRAWRNRNYGKYFGSRNVELKNAIVQAFKEDFKILLVTDSGSEGLNLQFCNTIINYDLPWNPQKIEQRIGRCHRYGQKSDVVVFNLLNRQNIADKRIYEILSNKFELFKGVFGASDRAIGLLESGADFEKRVSHIYQECKTSKDFTKEFTSLERELDRKRNKKMEQLKSLIIREAPEQHKETFEKILSDIQAYQEQLERV